MAHLKIGQGYNVPIKGQAKKETVDVGPAPFVGVCPSSFEHVKPKLHVAVNDEVVAGEVLFHDKANPNLVFVAPASGRITAINYGARRAIDFKSLRNNVTSPRHVIVHGFTDNVTRL